MNKELSGATIVFNNDGTVTKTGTERLFKQGVKQVSFGVVEDELGVLVPKVFSFNHTLTGFTMEKARGEPLLDIIEELGLRELDNIVKQLVTFINYCKSTRKPSDKDLGVTTYQKTSIPTKLSLKEESACHGDLTLENMMYDRKTGQLWLLDFLDSYHEHYFIDLVAPLQNSYYNFHGFLKGPRGPQLELFHALWVDAVNKNFPEVEDWDEYLIAAKFNRILPYVDEERSRGLQKWLSNATARLREVYYQ